MGSDENGVIIGVDIGATKIQLALLRGDGLDIFFRQPTPQEPGDAVDMIASAIDEAALNGSFKAIGIGCPGPLDQERGVVLSPPNLPSWLDFPLVARMQQRLSVPVRLENDGNAGALGEAVHGAAAAYRRVFYVTISSGIGSGMVIDKQVYRGAHGMAGEIWAFAPSTFFGKSGSGNINELAGGMGLVRQVRTRIKEGAACSIPADDVTTHKLIAAWEQGDTVATEVITCAHETLAATLCLVENLLAPDIIVLGGGLCTNPAWMVEPITALVQQWQRIDALKEIPIRRAKLWDEAVLYGAISLFRELESAG